MFIRPSCQPQQKQKNRLWHGLVAVGALATRKGRGDVPLCACSPHAAGDRLAAVTPVTTTSKQLSPPTSRLPPTPQILQIHLTFPSLFHLAFTAFIDFAFRSLQQVFSCVHKLGVRSPSPSSGRIPFVTLHLSNRNSVALNPFTEAAPSQKTATCRNPDNHYGLQPRRFTELSSRYAEHAREQ